MPVIAAALIAVTLGAWLMLFFQHQQMTNRPMAEMWMPPSDAWQWSSIDFAVVYSMWAVMMAAMMLPSALPMIKAYSRACRQRYHQDFPYSLLFSLAYLSIWFLFSVVLTLLQWQFHHQQWLTPMMENDSPWLAALILITAGLYQFSAFKQSCLHHCRTPASFLLNHWQNGHSGAFKMGMTHGLYCLGCCWAQMLLMFAVGVMNITAMIILTLFILLEKSLPLYIDTLSKTAGVLLCCWGTWLLI
ncbi:DUF2182 domain-containing protein [Methylomarinum sp. Ch1-1]|uniref:DUF2182 domain-containing protein n=1 Tax=Methylomarinum roseum TaxID=3067653 RepID=A0AAU7P0Z7_9GAMM|nr:DUF2182 domain-containing protein [Methylomarinum sp. Ch1-1]MDP4521375.1 DUF2182 domain-containing protein [Methylomarinum sp. Ch1-1]